MIARLLDFVDRLRRHPIYSRIARGGFWAVLGAFISRSLVLLATIPVARLLGQTQYGELGVLQSTVGLFGIFASFSLGMTATKYVAQYRNSAPQRAGQIMALSSLVSNGTALFACGALWCSADWLATRTLAAPHLAELLRISLPLLFLNAVTATQSGILAGLEAFRFMAHINLWFGLASCALIPAGAYWGSLEGTLWGLTLAQAVLWLLNRLEIRRQLNSAGLFVSWRHAWQERSILWSFSTPAILTAIVSVSGQWLANAWLVNQPGGYDEMGIFNATNQWRGLLAFIAGITGQILMPVLSDLHGRRQGSSFRRTVGVNLRMVSAVNLALCVPLVIAAPWIMASYGPAFADGTPVFVIAMAASTLSSILTIVGTAISSLGRMWDGFVLNTIWTVAFLFFVHHAAHLGAIGLASALLASYIVHTFTVGFYFFKFLPRFSETYD
jgi:O-antigen/teichoic acid export membrane protein